MVMVAKPVIPQTRIRFIGIATPRIPPSIGDTMAVPLSHDWGPMGSELAKPEVLGSFDEWTNRYGDSDTAARTAVAGAFAGQGLAGAGGAGGVIPYRMGAGAVRAFKVVPNTTPATAMTVTAKWAGVRGNSYTYTIDADPSDATRDRFRVLFNGVVVETYLYAKTDIASLVAAITARDTGNITATLQVTGVALSPASNQALATGTNGAAITSADHVAALAGLEFQPFTVVSPANLTDAPTQAAYLSWIQAQDVANRPVIGVFGGLAGETVDTAIIRSTALADPHVVNFGVGTLHDDLLNKDLSTAELAPRLAGILCALGEDSALTGAEIGGLHPIGTTGADTDEATAAILKGVTTLIRTDSEEADVRVAMGLTTFTSDVDVNRPRKIFSEPRFIRIMDLFVRRMRQWGDKKIVGKVPVNDDTRDAVRQQGSLLIDELLRRGLLLTKAGGADADPYITTPVTVDDTLPFTFGWQFAYTANFLLGEGRVK